MDNFFDGGIYELKMARQAILDEAEKTDAMNAALRDLKDKERELKELEKQVDEESRDILRAERPGKASPYDGDIYDADMHLQDSVRRRNEAKEEAVRERIYDEEGYFLELYSKLKRKTEQSLKNAGMPKICVSGLYYSLFAAKKTKDFVIFAIAAVIALVLIPNLVIFFLDISTTGKVFVYVAIVVFFVAAFFCIYKWGMVSYRRKTIEAARPDIEKLKKIKKRIRHTSKRVQMDGNEEQYELEDYDRAIERSEAICENAAAKRQAALEKSEQEYLPEVKRSIRYRDAGMFDEIHEELEFLKNDYLDIKEEVSRARHSLKVNYATYLGQDNMTTARIDELIDILSSGRAENILEALDVQRMR